MAHDWSGNVRELRNAIYRAAILSDGDLCVDEMLPACELVSATVVEAPLVQLDELGRGLMSHALARHGSYRRAAEAIGMSRSTFHDRARRYGLVSKP